MKLKTLKDLKTWCLKALSNPKPTRPIDEYELKQEAIKCGRHERTEHMNARDFILWFFDITAKDLK